MTDKNSRESPLNETIDLIDEKILRHLARDGRMSITALAGRVGLSKTPCQTRVRRLEERGFIMGYRAVLDPELLGRPHVVFIEVKLSDTRAPALRAFDRAVHAIPEVEECHLIAGTFDYLLKVRTRDIADYRTLLSGHISELPHVAHTSTHVSMLKVKDVNDGA